MTYCPSCERAESEPLRPEFRASCQSCCARAIASTSRFRASIGEIAKSAPYRLALAQFFPGKEEEGDMLARKWLQRIKAQERR
jgi:hypothetical protein